MGIEKDGIYRVGILKLDTNQNKLWIGDELRRLQPQQYKFLFYLIKHSKDNADYVVPKQDLYSELWGDDFVEDRRLNIIATELRGILGGKEAIINAPKVGYKFNPDFFINADKIICPWIGFESYNENDEDLFYGRDDVVNDLINRLQKNQFLLTVFGPSGVGKTSLVNAGLIPKLKKGKDISGSDEWKYISLRPTHRPLWDLSRKIASLKHPSSPSTDEIVDPILHKLRTNPKSIIQELQSVSKQKIFLFIDQIEGLMSRDTDKIEAELFVEALLQLSENKEIVQAIVINLRDSFHQAFSHFRELYNLLTVNLIPINELTREQLKEVIDEPASRELRLDEGLSSQIINELMVDTTPNSGVLPLLSNFLVELFDCRDGNKITLKHYLSIGGVRDSMGKYAEKVYEKFNREEKEIVKKLLILLTDVGEKPILDSCKPVSQKNILKTFPGQEEEVLKIIQKLIEERFLVNREDIENTVELPHSSLIRNWTKIQLLLEKERGSVRIAESLERQTQLWLDNGKNPEDLLKGTRLQIAEENYKQYKTYIGKNENEFFNASIFAENENKKKLDYEARRWKQLKRAFFTLVFLLIIAGVSFLYYRNTIKQLDIARMAANAALAELDKNPANALNLAIQAAETDKSENTIAILQAAIAGSHLRKLLTGHKDTLTAIAVSNDGKFLITASRDKTARIWGRESGRLLFKLEGHTKEVECASFSPDSKYAITSSSDGTVRVWDVSNGKETKKIETQQGGVNNVVFNPLDGKFILTAGENDTAVVWEFSSGNKRLVLQHPKESNGENLGINSAVFSPDGKLIATGSKDKTAIIWDASSGKPIKTLKHPDSVLNLAFSPDGKVLVTACRDGIARVWKVEDWSFQSELRGHQGQINCVSFNSTGERLITASMDRTAIIWDWQRGKNLLSLKGHTGAITSAIFSSDGRFVYTSSGDTEARVWEIREDFKVKTIEGYINEVYEISFSRDGQMLLTAAKDGTARLWNTNSGELIKLFRHDSAVRSAKLSPDEKFVATATEIGKIYLWEIESGKIVKTYAGHDNQVNSIIFDPTGKILASGDKSGVIKLWDIQSEEEINSLSPKGSSTESEITRLAFNRSGTFLAASSKDRSVTFWNMSSPTFSDDWRVGTGYINSVVFGENDSEILISGNDKSLRVWNMEEKKQKSVLLGHTDVVNYAEFSQDGKFITSASADSTVKIWSTRLQRELFSIEDKIADNRKDLNKGSPVVLYTSFSPNGKDIAYVDDFGQVKIISCPICSISSDELIKIAKERLPQRIED